jgi:5'-nucleotidase
VTSASSFGRLFTETNLRFNTKSQDILRPSAESTNMIVSRSVTPAADETSIIDKYSTLIAPIANKELGNITETLTRSAVGESTLGDLIADAQVNDPSVVTPGKTPVVAFMNPGGIRTDLNFPKTDSELVDGIVRYEEAFNVQPFNNYLVSMDMTGADIWSLLGQQWTKPNTGTNTKFLQVSKGLHYTVTGADTARVVTALTINGVAVPKDATVYRIVTNNFLADGGDNFLAFKSGTDRYFGGLDIDGFAKYLPTVSPYTPKLPLDRITQSP